MKKPGNRVTVRKRRIVRMVNQLDVLIAGLQKERDLLLRMKLRPSIPTGRRAA
jgi:hypothetical protein